MNAHTPGPWKVTSSKHGRRQLSGPLGKQIALIWRHSAAESHANECLIAAATDLLAALQALMVIDSSCAMTVAECDEIHAAAEAAVAKATGT